MHETEEEAKVTGIVGDNVSSQSTSSKHEGSVVSAVLATAYIAAAAFEAVAESRHKEESEHAEVKLDDRNKVTHDRDSSVGTETPTIKDNQRLTNEKDVVVNRTAQQQTKVVDSALSQKTTTTRTQAAVAFDKAQTDINRSRYMKSEIA